MSKNKDEKDYFDIMDSIDDINPYASYLDKSTLSVVDEWIDTGSMALNAIISGSLYKGVPKGRVVQFAGPSQTGKSFFVQKLIANAQKMGMYVVVFDSENAIEPSSAKGFGIDTSKVKYIPCVSIENTRNAIYKLCQEIKAKKKEGKFLIVVDSLANQESELGEKRMADDKTSADMGTFAKACKSLLKTSTIWGGLTKTTMVFTNHVFDNPAEMYPQLEKNMPGGRSAVYLPTVTVQLARKPVKADDGKTITNTLAAAQKNFSGVILRCLTVKNRLIKQYLEAELYLSFATGLDRYYGLLELAKGLGTVISTGTTYTDWEGNKLGFYKNWRTDTKLWEERLLPDLESRILAEWSYSNLENNEIPEDEYIDDDEDDNVILPDEEEIPYEED